MEEEAAAEEDAAQSAAAIAAGARPSSSTASATPAPSASSGDSACASSSTRSAESTTILGIECANLSVARKLVLDRISRESRDAQKTGRGFRNYSPYLVGREVTFPGVLPGPHVVWLPCRSSGACLSD